MVSATIREVDTSSCVRMKRPSGTPKKLPIANPLTSEMSASFSPPRNMNMAASISSAKQMGMISMGAMKLDKQAITVAESAKPENPRMSPARNIAPTKRGRTSIDNPVKFETSCHMSHDQLANKACKANCYQDQKAYWFIIFLQGWLEEVTAKYNS